MIKKIIYTLFIALCLAGLTGCRTVRTDKQKTITDTIYKDKLVTIRDTVFITKPATVKAAIPAQDFKGDLKPVQKQFKNAKLDIQKIHDTVYIECFCDTIAIKARLKETIEKEYRARSELTAQYEKQELSWWQTFMVSCGYLFWVFAIAGTAYIITKKRK